jgi:PAS domain S-box-containing protein
MKDLGPEWLLTTLKSIGDAVITTDAERRVTFMNPAACKLTGWTEAEATGRPLPEVLPLVDQRTGEPIERPAIRAMRERHPVNLPARTVLLAKDGRTIPIDDSTAPIFDDDGGIVGSVIIFRDGTERRRAEDAIAEAYQHQSAILESIADGFMAIDADWRLTYVNAESLRLCGMTRAEMIGKDHWELFPGSVGTEIERQFRRVAADQLSAEFENYYQPWGRWFSLKVYPAADGGITIYYRDITDQKRAEQELKDQEERYRLLAEANPIGIIQGTASGGVRFCNDAYCRITGYTKEDFESGRVDWASITPPEWLVVDRKQVAMAKETGYSPPYEKEYIRKDGSRVRVMIGFAVVGEDRESTVAFIMDLSALESAKSRLRESEELFRTMADNIPQLSWMARADGHLFWYNKRWYEYTGTTPEQVDGWGWQTVHDPELLPVIMERWKFSLERGEPFDMVLPLRGADGVFRPFLTRVNPVKDDAGQVVRWFGTNTDVTDQQRAERAIRDQSEQLRQADRKKDEFLAMLAHELRNPLASMSNAIQLLRLPNIPAEFAESSKDVIDRQVKHLARLIDDLLDVSRITRGKIELRKERFDASQVINSAVDAVRPLIEEKKHELSVSFKPGTLWCELDPTRLEQILINLLTNAARYTQAGGRIWLTARHEGDSVTFRVKDNGIGISPEKLPEMFELFTQGDRSMARSEGGLGVGLTIVKRIAELHGGNVSARSEGPGKGSEFTVSFPALPSPVPPPRNTPEIQSGSPRSSRILVVDDNVDSASGLSRLLGLLGMDIRTAHDGLTAIAEAVVFRPEFILLDIGLPGMDGYQVASQLRRDGLTDSVIIAVSGYGQEQDRRRSREAGFDHHLVKPIDYDALVTLIGQPTA